MFLLNSILIELIRKLNNLEEIVNDRYRQLNLANDQRRDFDRILTKLNEWIKNNEQQIKDPFTNDLQQTTNILKEKLKNIQVTKTYIFDHLENKIFDLYLVFTSINKRSNK
jgi:molecular chaperone DnaK (HSP70)